MEVLLNLCEFETYFQGTHMPTLRTNVHPSTVIETTLERSFWRKEFQMRMWQIVQTN